MTIPIFGESTGLPFLNWQIAVHRSSAFTGDTDDSHGDTDSGTPTPTYRLFTVTGDVVILACWGVINTDLTGATATVEVGWAGNTAGLIAQELATDMDDGAIYVSGTVADGGGAVAATLIAINDGADIIETSATANVQAGQIDYYCIWAPCEAGASVVPAPIDTLS
jgi:hypothetical protein